MTTRSAKATDWKSMDWKNLKWEDFRPEWANEGIERINNELERWNDELQVRSQKLRKASQKRIEKSVAQIQEELRKLPVVERAEAFRQDLETRVQSNLDAGLERVYTRLNLARLEELKKLEKKIAALNKKLRALEGETA